MARPKKIRQIKAPPQCKHFKPMGIPARFLEQTNLTIDEFESIRLADYEGLDHEAAAGRMGISRSSFTRLIDQSRQKIAQFLIEARQLCIDGGDFRFHLKAYRCKKCGFLAELKKNEYYPVCRQCHSKQVDLLNNQYDQPS